jgi:hypothetical protein
MAAGEDRPVLTGLFALVAVAVVVGLVLGGGALAASQVLGIGGDDTSAEATSADSMYLPKPSKTPDSNDPQYTFAPGEESSAPSESPSESEEPEEGITLSAGQTEVSAMQRIDLTGVYPGGEGAILQVERSSEASGGWEEFAVTVAVGNETFSTYVQTGQFGENKFRLRDTNTDEVSNVVTVTIR